MKKIVLFTTATLITTGIMTSANGLTQQAKDEIGRAAVDYMKENPKSFTEIIQSVQDFAAKEQEKQQQEKLAKHKTNLFTSGSLVPTMGNPNGSIEVILFMDPFCHYCRKFEETVKAALSANNDIKIIARDIAIMHPKSIMLIKAMLAAHKQGKYEEMQSALHKVTPEVTRDDIMKIAKDIGLNSDLFEKSMKDDAIDAQIKENMDLAEGLDIAATPSYIIKGKDRVFAGYVSDAEFISALTN